MQDPFSLLFVLPVPLLAIVAARQARVIPHDTAEYLAHTITRPPLYPLFLELTRRSFGPWLVPGTAIVQVLLGAASAAALARTMAARLQLGRLGLGLYLLLLIPQLSMAPVIGSDSLAYDFFLWMTAGAVEALFAPMAISVLLRPVVFASLAMLTRPQFLFVLPVLALGLAVALRLGRPRPSPRVALYALAILAGTVLAHKSYNYLFNHRFVTVPYTGIQLLTMNMYLMNGEDIELFQTPEDRRYVARVYERAAAQKLLYATKEFGDPTTHHLYEKYNPLCMGLIVGVWAEQFTSHRFDPELQSRSLSPDELVELDRFTLHIAGVLLKRHFFRYATLIVKCWYQYEGLFALLALLVGVIASVALVRTGERMWAVLVLASLLWAANNLLICMVEVILWRYAAYTDIVLLVTMVAAFLRFATPRPCAE